MTDSGMKHLALTVVYSVVWYMVHVRLGWNPDSFSISSMWSGNVVKCYLHGLIALGLVSVIVIYRQLL